MRYWDKKSGYGPYHNMCFLTITCALTLMNAPKADEGINIKKSYGNLTIDPKHCPV